MDVIKYEDATDDDDDDDDDEDTYLQTRSCFIHHLSNHHIYTSVHRSPSISLFYLCIYIY